MNVTSLPAPAYHTPLNFGAQAKESIPSRFVFWLKANGNTHFETICRRIIAVSLSAFLILSLVGIPIFVWGAIRWKTKPVVSEIEKPKTTETSKPDNVKIEKTIEKTKSQEKHLKTLDAKEEPIIVVTSSKENLPPIEIHFTDEEKQLMEKLDFTQFDFTGYNDEQIQNFIHLAINSCPNVTSIKINKLPITSLPYPLPSKLEILNTSDCEKLTTLGPELPSKLKTLYTQNCKLLELPQNLPSTLKTLLLTRNGHITKLNIPDSLEVLDANGCKNLNEFSGSAKNLKTLFCANCDLRSISIPKTVTQFNCAGNKNLLSIENKSDKITDFKVSGCTNLTTIDKLPKDLKKLIVGGCPDFKLPQELPETIETLDLRGNNFETIKWPHQLKNLDVQDSKTVKKIEGLPAGLVVFKANNCESLEEISNIPNSVLVIKVVNTPKLKIPEELTKEFLEYPQGTYQRK